MKPTPKELKALQRMQPGVITLSGFLGSDTRYLNEIITDDDAALASLGYSTQQIADRLDYFTRLSWIYDEDDITIDDVYLVNTEVYRGKLPCPFSHAGLFRKSITYLTNSSSGVSVKWTSLNVHLIREHGFFEGKDSPFRLDPAALIKAIF
jgi:hypothetical protein